MIHTLYDDDAPIGRVLTRREAVIALGGAGAAGLLFLTGCSTAAPNAGAGQTASASPGSSGTAPSTASASTRCVAKPELTEGPYFVDEKLNRTDVRVDTATGIAKAGTPLLLTFNVSRIASNACTPLAGAQVDIWHCDAVGVYSDANDPGFSTKGHNFLRGYQVSDANGATSFTTIVPGWYQGRASHVHFKIRGKSASGQNYDFTSQLFFTEQFLTALYTSADPYKAKGDAGRLRNTSDGIFNEGGAQLLVTPAKASNGYAASLNIGLAV